MGAYTRNQGDPTKQRPMLEGQAQEWMAPNVPNGGRSTKHAEQVGNTMYHNGKKVQMGLESQAKEWRAPMAGDSTRGSTSTRGGSSTYMDKAGQHSLVTQVSTWPGPQARDHRSAESQKSDEELWGSKGLPLERVAVCHFHPPLFQDQPMPTPGAPSSSSSPNSDPPSPKRKLNPYFVEALMRWPSGLSGIERQETAWTRWWLLMPGFVSTLFSAIPEQKQRDLF